MIPVESRNLKFLRHFVRISGPRMLSLSQHAEGSIGARANRRGVAIVIENDERSAPPDSIKGDFFLKLPIVFLQSISLRFDLSNSLLKLFDLTVQSFDL